MSLSKYRGKTVVVVHPSCPACRELKQELSSKGPLDDVVLLDVTKDEDAIALARAFNIKYVPSFFSVNEEGGKTKVCMINPITGDVEKCAYL